MLHLCSYTELPSNNEVLLQQSSRKFPHLTTDKFPMHGIYVKTELKSILSTFLRNFLNGE